MNKRIWMVALLAMALGACSVSRQLAAPEKCQPGNNITIHHGGRGILVAPPDLCVGPGDTITVNIVPPAKKNTVGTKPKPGNPGLDHWMNGSNSQFPGRFSLKVPEDAPACPIDMVDDSCRFRYAIVITDFVIMDPMITIRQ